MLVDLPGVQRPRDALTGRMQSRVEHELADADAVLLVLDGEQGVGPGDRFIARSMLDAGEAPAPVVCAVNKIDRLGKPAITEALAAAEELDVADEIVPVSARTGTGVEELTDLLGALMPEGPPLHPPGDRSDLTREVMAAELIREQVLRRTREEVPHAVEVAVQSLSVRDDGLVEVIAEIWVEADSQKGIVVGKGGRMIREIGTAARKELERELVARVFLDLQVKVRSRWRRDDGLLDRLGYD